MPHEKATTETATRRTNQDLAVAQLAFGKKLWHAAVSFLDTVVPELLSGEPRVNGTEKFVARCV